MPQLTLSPEILTAALEGLELQKQKLDAQIAEVKRMLAGPQAESVAPEVTAPAAPEAKVAKRRLSLAARRRIAEAQRKRWQEHRSAANAAPAAEKPKAKAAPKSGPQRLSAEGRKRIIEATKKRWAEFRAKKAAKA